MFIDDGAGIKEDLALQIKDWLAPKLPISRNHFDVFAYDPSETNGLGWQVKIEIPQMVFVDLIEIKIDNIRDKEFPSFPAMPKRLVGPIIIRCPLEYDGDILVKAETFSIIKNDLENNGISIFQDKSE